MALVLIFTLSGVIGLAVAILWVKFASLRKTKDGEGYWRDGTEVDPKSVPEFRSTWKDFK